MRLPIGSSPGQYLAAIASLMTITAGAEPPSRSVKPRPLISGMPSVEKYSGLIANNDADVRDFGSVGRPSIVKPTSMSLPDIGSVVEMAEDDAPGSTRSSSRRRA